MQSTNDILSNHSIKQNKSDNDDIKKNDINSKRSIDQDNVPSSSFEKLWDGSSSVSEVSMSDYSDDLSSDEEKVKKSEKKYLDKNENKFSKLKKNKIKKHNHSSDVSDISTDADNDIIPSKKKESKSRKIKSK